MRYYVVVCLILNVWFILQISAMTEREILWADILDQNNKGDTDEIETIKSRLGPFKEEIENLGNTADKIGFMYDIRSSKDTDRLLIFGPYLGKEIFWTLRFERAIYERNEINGSGLERFLCYVYPEDVDVDDKDKFNKFLMYFLSNLSVKKIEFYIKRLVEQKDNFDDIYVCRLKEISKICLQGYYKLWQTKEFQENFSFEAQPFYDAYFKLKSLVPQPDEERNVQESEQDRFWRFSTDLFIKFNESDEKQNEKILDEKTIADREAFFNYLKNNLKNNNSKNSKYGKILFFILSGLSIGAFIFRKNIQEKLRSLNIIK